MDPRPGGFRATVVPAVPGPSDPPSAADGSSTTAITDDVDAQLAQLDGLPVTEHAALFADIHQRLTSALNATTGHADQEQPPQPRGR